MLRLLARSVVALLTLVLGGLVLFWTLAWLRESEAAVPAQITMVTTPLGRVAADISGPVTGTPVLLVHGTAGWSGFWREVSAHLAARGFRVIAVDVPPFGYSEHDPQARYDRLNQAKRLAAVLAATARRPAIVVAHSFGGGAATELALREPRQVAQLVLVDPALGSFAPTVSRAPAAMRPRLIAEPLVAASVTNPLALGPLLGTMLARKEAADRWIETLRAPMQRPGTTTAYAAWLPNLLASDEGGLSRDRAKLAAIVPRVDLIWGAADTVTPIAQGEALAALVKPCSFAKLPGVGHIPHIEDPAAFLAALDTALAQPSSMCAGRPSSGSGRTGRGPSPAR